MILVREVFQLKIGKAKEAKVLWKEAVQLAKKQGSPEFRALTDLTGPYYTFVFESTHKNLAEWESGMGSTEDAEAWSQWYQRFAPLIDGGHREIFTIVE